MCFKPISGIVPGFLALKSVKYSFSTPSCDAVNEPLFINSKKQRVVASTSAVALWASAKGLLNKY